MTTLVIETRVAAPIDVCFDLARSVDAHLTTSAATRERAVAGKTSGLLDLGDEVTLEAVHFGVRQRLTSRIVEFERPTLFVVKALLSMSRARADSPQPGLASVTSNH